MEQVKQEKTPDSGKRSSDTVAEELMKRPKLFHVTIVQNFYNNANPNPSPVSDDTAKEILRSGTGVSNYDGYLNCRPPSGLPVLTNFDGDLFNSTPNNRRVSLKVDLHARGLYPE